MPPYRPHTDSPLKRHIAFLGFLSDCSKEKGIGQVINKKDTKYPVRLMRTADTLRCTASVHPLHVQAKLIAALGG